MPGPPTRWALVDERRLWGRDLQVARAMPTARRRQSSFPHSPLAVNALTTVDEAFEDAYNYWSVIGGDKKEDECIAWGHGYRRTLRGFEDWIRRETEEDAGFSKARGLSLCISLPDPIAARQPGFGGFGRRGYRSLSAPLGSPIKMAAEVHHSARLEEVNEDTTENDTTAPNSPPELSYSKSSKSSDSGSLSETSSDDDGEDSVSTEKLSHYDDVSVEDDIGRTSIGDSNLRPESRPTLKRPAPRTARTTGDVLHPNQPKSASPPIGAKENRYPSLNSQVSGALRDQSLNLPRGMRRGFTSPSSPALAQKHDSRSPSPSKPFMQNGVSVTPEALASATPRLSNEVLKSPSANGSGFFARRASWQPGRRSAKDLEAEYNDDDDEVPDEAVLENVPMSPMPGQRRYSPQPSRSTTPSPNRRPPPSPHPPTQSSRLHSANVPKNAKRPSIATILPNGKYGAAKSPRSPRHPRPPPLQHSATVGPGNFPLEGGFSYRQRSKSWTEDLNDEARHLSAALEEFAERESMEKHGHGSGLNSATSSPPRNSTGSAKKENEYALRRSRTGLVDFPQPNRKGSAMMDPLPISREKEAALSRTRPSWLPPKCQKEEKRHLKEWEQMMARAQEAEKKRLLKENEAMRSQSDLKVSMAKLWEQHVIPNWEDSINDSRTRELWWRGVASESRGIVWQKAIGNELELSEASFDAALKRAHTLEDKVAAMAPEERGRSIEAAWLNAIARDVPTALPSPTSADGQAKDLTALRKCLSDVLKAYMTYRSDVGYVYGTHLVAGMLMAYLPSPSAAFVALANLLNRPLPLAFLVHDQSAMARIYELVLQTLKYKSPLLHKHLTAETTDIHPEEYLDPIFRCLFVYNLPAGHVARVWDIFVFERDMALIRAAVAVLTTLESKLYGSREEVLDLISWRNEGTWDLGSEDDFVKAIRDAGKIDAAAKADKALEKVASAGA